MGCDIHLYVEKRDPFTGAWKTADTWVEDKYEPGRMALTYDKSFYNGRNYDLFAILADVRNGRGFAGVKTGEGFNPISSPRGIPPGASPEYLKECRRWGGDGHSHSYFTVTELLTYDWTQVTSHFGFVTLKEWARWKQCGKPDDWCGMVDGPTVRKVSPDVVEQVCSELGIGPRSVLWDETELQILGKKLGGGTIYVPVSWREPYYKSCSEFLSECLPKLLRVGPPEDVRIVFFFDN